MWVLEESARNYKAVRQCKICQVATISAPRTQSKLAQDVHVPPCPIDRFLHSKVRKLQGNHKIFLLAMLAIDLLKNANVLIFFVSRSER